MPTTTAPEQNLARPEFYRLPKPRRPKYRDAKIVGWLPAEHDPYFGFSRSFYYLLEERRVLKLFRIRDEGKEKGVTLIRYRDVWNYVNAQVAQQEAQS